MRAGVVLVADAFNILELKTEFLSVSVDFIKKHRERASVELIFSV